MNKRTRYLYGLGLSLKIKKYVTISNKNGGRFLKEAFDLKPFRKGSQPSKRRSRWHGCKPVPRYGHKN